MKHKHYSAKSSSYSMAWTLSHDSNVRQMAPGTVRLAREACAPAALGFSTT
jgi:hypothetical protein